LRIALVPSPLEHSANTILCRLCTKTDVQMPRRHPRPKQRPVRPLGPTADFVARRRANCATKERYASEAEARSIALMNAPRSRGAAVTAYHCDICDGWHLTSR
jgi:hypothetical protein